MSGVPIAGFDVLSSPAVAASVPPTNCRRLIVSMNAPLRERSYLGATTNSSGHYHNTDLIRGQLLHRSLFHRGGRCGHLGGLTFHAGGSSAAVGGHLVLERVFKGRDFL